MEGGPPLWPGLTNKVSSKSTTHGPTYLVRLLSKWIGHLCNTLASEDSHEMITAANCPKIGKLYQPTVELS